MDNILTDKGVETILGEEELVLLSNEYRDVDVVVQVLDILRCMCISFIDLLLDWCVW